VLQGNLTGTDNQGQSVQLLANPYPYTSGFLPYGNPVLTTDASGAFSITVSGLAVNTQFKVAVPEKTESPIAYVGVQVGVGEHVKKLRRHRYRFSGTLTPAVDGATVLIQRKAKHGWRTVAKTFAHHHGNRSAYRRTLRIRHRGRFRVSVQHVFAAYVAHAGRTLRIR
jgi:hypothetical protein